MASLGKDLAYLRKQKNLTLDDIYDLTRIPKETIESIEDDSIFTEFNENFTYIRSFIRSYARALKLDEDVIIKALDQAETGNYDDLLLQKYAPDHSNKPRKFQLDVDEGEDEGEDKETSDEEPFDETTSGEKEQKAPDKETPEKTPEPEKRTRIEGRKGTYQQHDPSRPKRQDVPKAPNVDNVNWADVGKRFIQFESRSPIWILFIVLIVIVAAAVFYFFYSGSNLQGNLSSTSTPTEQELSMPDSLQMQLQEPVAQETTEVAGQTGAMEHLSDTLYLVVYAARDKLEPVRVRSDVIDDFMPYWIEQGDAMRFEFTDFIDIKGQYSRMVLLFNGHPITNFRDQLFQADSNYVEIQRSFFENDPEWRSAPPDSLPLDVPEPSRILDRPIFP